MTSSKNTLKRLDWTYLASRDRDSIFCYISIDEQSPMNAVLVDGRILNTALMLELHPLLGTKKNSKYLLPVKKTQYTIVYKVFAKSVRIIRIIHQKRKYF